MKCEYFVLLVVLHGSHSSCFLSRPQHSPQCPLRTQPYRQRNIYYEATTDNFTFHSTKCWIGQSYSNWSVKSKMNSKMRRNCVVYYLILSIDYAQKWWDIIMYKNTSSRKPTKWYSQCLYNMTMPIFYSKDKLSGSFCLKSKNVSMAEKQARTCNLQQLEHSDQIYQPYISGLTQNRQNFSLVQWHGLIV